MLACTLLNSALSNPPKSAADHPRGCRDYMPYPGGHQIITGSN